MEIVNSWMNRGVLLHPLEGESIVDVSRSLVVKSTENKKLLFVLLDGLGMNLFEKLMKEYHKPGKLCNGNCGSFFCRFYSRPVRSIFPAATAAALTSYGTGNFPSQHGILGWVLRYSDTKTALSDMKSEGIFYNPLPWKTVDKQPLNIPEESVFAFSSCWRDIKLPRRSISVFADSKATRAYTATAPNGSISPGVQEYGLAIKCDGLSIDLSEALEKVEEIWRGNEPGNFTYVYCHHPDSLEHAHGVFSLEVNQKLKQLDKQLMEFWERTETVQNQEVVVCADHGQVDGQAIYIPRVIKLDGRFGCSGAVRLDNTMEHRCPMVWLTHSGCTGECSQEKMVEFVIETLSMVIVEQRKSLGIFCEGEEDLGWAFLLPEEIKALKLFGPAEFSPAAEAQLGHFLGITRTNEYLTFKDEGLHVVGMHGSLVPQEVLVPLFEAKN